MTNEEAKIFLQSRIKLIDKYYPQVEDYREALDVAIKALEQQPCEDCISRESVRQLICKNNDKYGYSDRFHEFTEECLQLPSVTPQQKVGRWIDVIDEKTEITEMHHDECSNCGYHGWNEYSYCPNCGAKMEVEDEKYEAIIELAISKWDSEYAKGEEL